MNVIILKHCPTDKPLEKKNKTKQEQHIRQATKQNKSEKSEGERIFVSKYYMHLVLQYIVSRNSTKIVIIYLIVH